MKASFAGFSYDAMRSCPTTPANHDDHDTMVRYHTLDATRIRR